MESCSRHFLVWVNRWQDDGFKPLFDAWMHRLDHSFPGVVAGTSGVVWPWLAVSGAKLLKVDSKPISIPPHKLETICGTPALVEPQA